MTTVHPEVLIAPVARKHKPVLANLVQFYKYDFSEIRQLELTPHGTYDYIGLDYFFNEVSREAFFVLADDTLAGFALTQRRDGRNHLAEFFVMRAFRRRGVGRIAAHKIFRRYPGRWSLEVDHANTVAMRFWTSTIGDIALGEIERVDRFPPQVDYASALLRFETGGPNAPSRTRERSE